VAARFMQHADDEIQAQGSPIAPEVQITLAMQKKVWARLLSARS
jgi:hypothetical protein